MEYSVLRLCRNRAGFEAVPERRLGLDLGEVAGRVTKAGHEVVANAGVLLIVRFGAVEASVFESGKVLFKTKDETAAGEGMRRFREAMGWT